MTLLLALSAHAAAPDVPVLLAPLDGTVVADHTPELRMGLVEDPDGDPVDYTFFVEDLDGNPLYSAVGGHAGPYASLQITEPILEDTWTCWYGVASDGTEESVSETACFFVTVTNDPPTAPQFLNPQWVGTSANIEIQNGVDAEQRGETQILELHDAQGRLLESTRVDTNGAGTTPWTVSLDEDTVYVLMAQTTDGLRVSEWATLTIQASDQNDPPGAPKILSPAENRSAAEPLAVEVRNAMDPEDDVLTYRMELRDSADQVVDSVEGLAEGEDTTLWGLGELANGRYTVVAWADDGELEGPPSSERHFYVGPAGQGGGNGEGQGNAARGEGRYAGGGGGGCSSAPNGAPGLGGLLLAGVGLLLLRRRR